MNKTFSIEIEKGKNELIATKKMFKNIKIQLATKDGETIETDIDTSAISKPKGEQNNE